jgi:hypothetical protein
MKKNFIYSLAATLMMGSAALGISSCSNDELPVGNEAQIAKDGAKTYSFSVQAVMDNEAGTRVFTLDESAISSAFSTEEPIYVFIKNSKGDIAYGNKAINPVNVSDDGQSCTIDVTVKDDFYFIPTTFTPAEGDEIYLYYGMTSDTSNHINGYFDFATDGKKATAEGMDYNLAKTTIESVDNDALTFNDKFSFTNINSIFRQNLTFVDEYEDPIDPSLTITKVVISSASNKMVKRYIPFGGDNAYEYGPIVIDIQDLTDGNIYFSTIFSGGGEIDKFTFTAYDEDGNTYSCTKGAPGDGFENNMYYYGDAKLDWISDQPTPVINGLSNYAFDDDNGVYTINDNPANFSISGDMYNNMFGLVNGGTVTLDNINATIDADGQSFMMVGNDYNGLTLNLKGNSYITMNNYYSAFNTNGSPVLKLRCEGESATLTISSTTAPDDYSGFQAFGNIDFTNTGGQGISSGTSAIDETDPENYDKLQEIAADDNNDGNPDYTVKRSEIVGDGNGAYFWTFTVEKN